MYSIDKYAADAYAAQRKQLEEKLAKFDALQQAYVARERAANAYGAAQNEDGQGANTLIAERRRAYFEAGTRLENALLSAFGPVSDQWRP